MNPRSRRISLRANQPADVDLRFKAETQKPRNQQTRTEYDVDKAGHSPFFRDKDASPDKCITLKQAAEVHADNRTGGDRQRCQVEQVSPPGGDQRSGDGIPMGRETARQLSALHENTHLSDF